MLRCEPGRRQLLPGVVGINPHFHDDNGAGLGAMHQPGWTGLVADVIRRRHGEVGSIGDLLRDLRACGSSSEP